MRKDLLKEAMIHKGKLDTYRKDVANNEILLKRKDEELQQLLHQAQITKISAMYLDRLIKEESGKFIQNLTRILEHGVKTIFFDCNYSAEVRVSEEGKSASIHLIYDDEDGNHLEPNIKDCGGGIRSVIGALLQIFWIFYYKVEPIIFIDEGLSQISSQYVGPFMGLIGELAEKNNFRILLITHDTRLMGYANKSYEVKNGLVKEIEAGGSYESN